MDLHDNLSSSVLELVPFMNQRLRSIQTGMRTVEGTGEKRGVLRLTFENESGKQQECVLETRSEWEMMASWFAPYEGDLRRDPTMPEERG